LHCNAATPTPTTAATPTQAAVACLGVRSFTVRMSNLPFELPVKIYVFFFALLIKNRNQKFISFNFSLLSFVLHFSFFNQHPKVFEF